MRTMNSQEQRLIEDLFTRLQSISTAEKDEDAEQHIRGLVARFPDAPYYLTQSVLVQQQALDRADARIKELEQLAQQARPGSQRSATSFLGGSSVPQTGRRDPDVPRPAEQLAQSPWAQPSPARSGGGFLSSALSTATGVAGGMFLADSIRSLFGGGGGGILGSGSASASENQAALDKAQDDAQDAKDDAEQARQDLAADDAALDDMQDEQDGDWSDDDGSLDV
jgi:hypothetical protein